MRAEFVRSFKNSCQNVVGTQCDRSYEIVWASVNKKKRKNVQVAIAIPSVGIIFVVIYTHHPVKLSVYTECVVETRVCIFFLSTHNKTELKV